MRIEHHDVRVAPRFDPSLPREAENTGGIRRAYVDPPTHRQPMALAERAGEAEASLDRRKHAGNGGEIGMSGFLLSREGAMIGSQDAEIADDQTSP